MLNALVQYLEPQDVFQSKSNSGQEQMPVDWQLLITFFHIGCYGN